VAVRAGRVGAAPRSPRAVALASENAVGENPEHADSDYVVLGLAQCYVKDEESKLQEVLVIEPIPAAAVECMDNGGVTSYLHAVGVTLGTALQEDAALLPEEFRARPLLRRVRVPGPSAACAPGSASTRRRS